MFSIASIRRTGAGRSALAIALLLLLALAARIWGAWCLRYSTDSDAGIVYLMVRHMIQGVDWPVFFYGQGYMGNVEPLFSAALCAVAGYSPLVVNLGTALLGWAALIPLAIWAADIAGRRGALWALLIAAIGPPTFFGFQVSPRGGYAVTLLLGTLLTAWMVRLVQAERKTGRIRAAPFFVWGLLAGLGFWANALILPALAAAGCTALIGLGRTLWRPRRILAGALGLAVGSAPFWIWTGLHHGESLSLLENLQPAAWGQRALALLTQRLPDFFEVPRGGSPLALLGLFLILAPPLLAVGWLWRHRRDSRALPVVAALLQVAFLLLFYCASRFADTGLVRYLTPLLIPWTLLVVLALDLIARKYREWIAWPLALLLAAANLHALRDFYWKSQKDAAQHTRAHQLAALCRDQSIDLLYAGFQHHWLNAALDESIRIVTPAGERLVVNAARAEAQSEPAFFQMETLDAFLRHAGGSAQTVALPGTPWTLQRNLIPPPTPTLLKTDLVPRSARDQEGAELDALFDANLATASPLGDQTADRTWTFHFPTPIRSAGVRLFLDPPDGILPPFIAEGRTESAGETWRPLAEGFAPTRYFWSGARPFLGGRFYRFEARWPTQTLDRIRLHFPAQAHPVLVHVAEIQWFVAPDDPPAPPPDFTQALPEVIRHIRRRQPSHLYADRWLLAQLDRFQLPPFERPDEPAIRWDGASPIRPAIPWHPDLMLIVEAASAPAVDRLLSAQGLTLRQTPAPPWVIFDFAPGPWRADLADDRRWIWTGTGPLLQSADAPHPPSPPPTLPLSIRFRNGARLVGITPRSDLSPAPGGFVRLIYHWECPPGLNPHHLAVFTHFQGDAFRFQDDHLWLAPFPPSLFRQNPGPHLALTAERLIPIPADTPPGDYRLRIGLLDQRTARRVPCASPHPIRRRAVQTPLIIRVQANPSESTLRQPERNPP